MANSTLLRGSCLCGDVRFRVEKAQVSPASACHCSQCRKWSGHYWVAARLPEDELVLESGAESLAWYPCEHSERGFCVICGSSLFWRQLPDSQGYVAVSLGVFDTPTGLELKRHIFAADAPDYYTVPAGPETFPGDDE